MVELGRLYFDRQPLSALDAALAEEWLHLAAESSVEAQFLLGLLLTTVDPAKLKPLMGVGSAGVDPQHGDGEGEEEHPAKAVRREIMLLRKNSAMQKRAGAGGGSKQDFEAALARRRARSEQTSALGTPGAPKAPVAAPQPPDASAPPSELAEQADRRQRGERWLQLAAAAGHGQSMCLLGNTLLAQSQQDPAAGGQKLLQALGWYERAAEVSAEAAFNLGMLLHEGLSVTRVQGRFSPVTGVTGQEQGGELPDLLSVDLPRSLYYFEQAASLGEKEAILWCGICHSSGEGGASEVNPQLALAHFTAALGGDTGPKAHFYLSQMHRSGLQGSGDPVPSSVERFLHHLELARAGGDCEALFSLADMHMQIFARQNQPDRGEEDEDEKEGEGEGKEHVIEEEDQEEEEEEEGVFSAGTLAFLEKDLGRAGHECGSAGGCSGSSGGSGSVSSSGGGGEAHLHRGVLLYQLSSQGGLAEATLCLGALTYQGLLQDTDTDTTATAQSSRDRERLSKQRAFELYGLAAEQGSLEAWRNIAAMHYTGDGVPRNPEAAREIMRVMFPPK
ncbi:hypothetical protein B484DRAFT_400684 [Ochromonadaceae sp. CCMP2298]|nr:hypothetical protein B484DRAFT_400684 [Ochromonadaceae sp. CCMP2298]